MSYYTNNILSATPINSNAGYNNSWVSVENNADRELYAQLNYITNLSDVVTQLSAADVNVQIQDGSSNLTANVVSSGESQGALLVRVDSTIDVITRQDAGELFAFNNHAVAVHRGWTIDGVMRPVLSIQNGSNDVEDIVKVLNYEICLNPTNTGIVVYEWYEGPLNLLGSTLPGWSTTGNHIQYRFYEDVYGSNDGFIFSVPANTHMRHSGILVNKNVDNDEVSVDLNGSASRNMLTLCMKRVDSNTKMDVWFAVSCKEMA